MKNSEVIDRIKSDMQRQIDSLKIDLDNHKKWLFDNSTAHHKLIEEDNKKYMEIDSLKNELKSWKQLYDMVKEESIEKGKAIYECQQENKETTKSMAYYKLTFNNCPGIDCAFTVVSLDGIAEYVNMAGLDQSQKSTPCIVISHINWTEKLYTEWFENSLHP